MRYKFCSAVNRRTWYCVFTDNNFDKKYCWDSVIVDLLLMAGIAMAFLLYKIVYKIHKIIFSRKFVNTEIRGNFQLLNSNILRTVGYKKLKLSEDVFLIFPNFEIISKKCTSVPHKLLENKLLKPTRSTHTQYNVLIIERKPQTIT